MLPKSGFYRNKIKLMMSFLVINKRKIFFFAMIWQEIKKLIIMNGKETIYNSE